MNKVFAFLFSCNPVYENMFKEKKSSKKKLILLTSCLFVLLFNLWTQYTYIKMEPLSVLLVNDEGSIAFRNHIIRDNGDTFYFIIPKVKDHQVFVQVNKGKYLEVKNEKIKIDMQKVNAYKKNIYISFLEKNYLTGKKKHQTYIFK